MRSTHLTLQGGKGEKKERTESRIAPSALRSVTPAEEHDDTSADDVEPGLLLPQHPLQLPPLLLLLPFLHVCQQGVQHSNCAKVWVAELSWAVLSLG